MMKRSGLSLLAALTMAGAAYGQSAAPAKTEKATFAGGCFWCVETDLDKVEGVISTTSGYIGGKTAKPTYRQVSSGGTGHAEAVEIVSIPPRFPTKSCCRYSGAISIR